MSSITAPEIRKEFIKSKVGLVGIGILSCLINFDLSAVKDTNRSEPKSTIVFMFASEISSDTASKSFDHYDIVQPNHHTPCHI